MSWAQLLEEKSSLATALDLVGDKWSLMILSSCLTGPGRFNQFEQYLGINRTLLSKRLNRLIAVGLIEKLLYQQKPKRYEYKITKTALELKPIIIGLAAWATKHYTKDAAPITLIHKNCGNAVHIEIYCDGCDDCIPGSEITMRINPRAGPNARSVYENMIAPHDPSTLNGNLSP